MKKHIIILAILLAAVVRVFPQDTISGVVSRVAAPYFEQNVCDSRFAIVSEGETYYVMVDGYWPNPYLEDLVVHYDTIPVGSEMEVVGNILEMEDENADAFRVFDISKYLGSDRLQVLGFFDYAAIPYPGPDTITAAGFYHYYGMSSYYLTINGELQTEEPFFVNGRQLVQHKRYLFIGKENTLTDYNGNSFIVLELADALPYDVEDVSRTGILTMENELFLSSPFGETRFLSLYGWEEHRCIMQKRNLQSTFINDAVFNEGDSVEVFGFEFICHDIFGNPFTAIEAIKINSNTEKVVVGGVGDGPMPYVNVGPPLPGVSMAFYSDNNDNKYYYLRNPHGTNGQFEFGYYVVGDDTVQVTMQQVIATFYGSMFVDNYLNPCYRANITQVEFEEHEETLQCTLVVVENLFYFGNTLAVCTQDDEIYYLKPYIYETSVADHITVGDRTIHVGDSFLATGMVSKWYHNQYFLKNVIDITSVEFEGVQESHSPEVQVFPNPSNGIVEIVSKQPIKSISVYDCLGQALPFDYDGLKRISLDLHGFKGVVLICVFFEDGHKTIKKEIIK